MTSPAQAKRFVVLSVLGTGALAVVKELADGDAPPLRIGLGVVAAGVLFAAGAEIAPEVAAGLALVMLTTAALVRGGDAWAAISRSLS